MNKDSLIYAHAKRELDLLSGNDMPDNKPVVLDFIPHILEFIKSVDWSEESGGSMPYVANVVGETIRRLLLLEPISPITGEAIEWHNVTGSLGLPNDEFPDLFQNKRCPALFKEGIDGVAFYNEAIIWVNSNNKNDCFYGAVRGINSNQYVKSYPFVPKTFRVLFDYNLDNIEELCFDPKQLAEVFEYYQPSLDFSKPYLEFSESDG